MTLTKLAQSRLVLRAMAGEKIAGLLHSTLATSYRNSGILGPVGLAASAATLPGQISSGHSTSKALNVGMRPDTQQFLASRQGG